MADQGGEGLLSPWLRHQRIRAALPFIKGRVLDVGAGSGTLAKLFKAEQYQGVEIDPESLEIARQTCPGHQFTTDLPHENELFDSVVALAVLEHVKDPIVFLATLAQYLQADSDACITITTPHPSADWIHTAGSRLGLFSQQAHEEHENLLNKDMLTALANSVGLRLAFYRRFQLGLNQLAVFKRT